MIKPIIRIILLILACGAIGIALAKEVYQEPQAFLQEVFNGKVPKPRLLWITKARRVVQRLAQNFLVIFGHSYPFWATNSIR